MAWPRPEIAPLGARRLLIVEDEKMASFVRRALQAEGCSADVVHHGDEALAAMVATALVKAHGEDILVGSTSERLTTVSVKLPLQAL